jgi:hypothetical protein
MFPVREPTLSLGDVAKYWSREIHPQASLDELLSTIIGAFWMGEIRPAAISRFDLLKNMFRLMHDRSDVELVFITCEEPGPPEVSELPGGTCEVDLRQRIPVPSSNSESWTEDACSPAFYALSGIKSIKDYGDFAPILWGMKLTYKAFASWLEQRSYVKPSFWAEQIAPDAATSGSESFTAHGAKSRGIKEVITELWPGGIPEGLIPKERDQAINAKLKEKGYSVSHPRTIQRKIRELKGKLR